MLFIHAMSSHRTMLMLISHGSFHLPNEPPSRLTHYSLSHLGALKGGRVYDSLHWTYIPAKPPLQLH